MEKHFSDATRAIIQTSGRLATQFKYESVEPEHLLLAIIDESLKNPAEGAMILAIFKRLNVNLFNLIEDIESSLDVAKTTSPKTDRLPLSKQTEKILKISYLEAKIFRSHNIRPEHILLSYLRNGSAFTEETLKSKYNMTYQNVHDTVEQIN